MVSFSSQEIRQTFGIDVPYEEKYVTEEEQLKVVSRNWTSIRQLRNPSANVCIAAGKQNPAALSLIDKVTDYIGIEVMKEHIDAIRYIRNPSFFLCLAAICQPMGSVLVSYIHNIESFSDEELIKFISLADFPIIQYIPNPSEYVQMAAVLKRGSDIAFIKNPSIDVCKAAINQTPSALQYINIEVIEKFVEPFKFKSGDFCNHPDCSISDFKKRNGVSQMVMMGENSFSFRETKNIPEINFKRMKDREIAAILKKDGLALRYVPYYRRKQSLCLIAVKQNGLALEFIKHQTRKICKAALRQNGMAIVFVKKITVELWEIAACQSNEAFEYLCGFICE